MARGCVVEGPGREESKNLRWLAGYLTLAGKARVDLNMLQPSNQRPPPASLRQFPCPGQERN